MPQVGAELRHNKSFEGLGEGGMRRPPGIEIPGGRGLTARGGPTSFTPRAGVGSDAEAAYEHQYPVEYGKIWPQVWGLGLVVVPQALHFQ